MTKHKKRFLLLMTLAALSKLQASSPGLSEEDLKKMTDIATQVAEKTVNNALSNPQIMEKSIKIYQKYQIEQSIAREKALNEKRSSTLLNPGFSVIQSSIIAGAKEKAEIIFILSPGCPHCQAAIMELKKLYDEKKMSTQSPSVSIWIKSDPKEEADYLARAMLVALSKPNALALIERFFNEKDIESLKKNMESILKSMQAEDLLSEIESKTTKNTLEDMGKRIEALKINGFPTILVFNQQQNKWHTQAGLPQEKEFLHLLERKWDEIEKMEKAEEKERLEGL